MAGGGLLATSQRVGNWGTVATVAAGLKLLLLAIELRSLHRGQALRGTGGGQRVPWVKPWGRSGSGGRRDGLRRARMPVYPLLRAS